MIYVIMKDGRVIQYNRCYSYESDSAWTTLREQPGTFDGDEALAKIASHDIERLEFEKPCKITDKRGRNVKVNY